MVVGGWARGIWPGCRWFEANGWHVPLRLVIMRAIIIFMQLNFSIHILFLHQAYSDTAYWKLKYSELTKTSTALSRLAVLFVLSAARRLVLI